MTTVAASQRNRVEPDRVHSLFHPRSIALIGATDKSEWSAVTFSNLVSRGFDGDVHLVNPRGNVVHGRQSFASIADLPDGVDLAYIMVSVANVLPVLRDLALRDIRNAVILTAGFGEAGEEGRKLEREVHDFATESGMLILGPNGNGYVNASDNITPFGLGIPATLEAGSVGVVLQSGGLASAVLKHMHSRAVGISVLVSMGNELMMSLSDVVRYLVADPDTKVIALFVESIRDPEEFLRALQLAFEAGKPVVALKVGSSQASARVAMAHTGSLVGDDAVVDAVFRANGVIRVRALEDLVTTSDLLARCGGLAGKRIGVVTASGGACGIIADRAEAEGLELPEFTEETLRQLEPMLPDFASAQNPVDVTGYIMVRPDLLAHAVKAVQADPAIDLTVLLYDLPGQAPPPEYEDAWIGQYRMMAEVIKSSPKPVLTLTETLNDITEYGREVARSTGFPPVFGGIEHTLTALGHAVRWSERRRAATSSRTDELPVYGELAALAPDESVWTEHRASEFLAAQGVPMSPSVLATLEDEAVQAAEGFGYPVVIKMAADVEHKSDIGGVRLGVADAEAVRQTFREMVDAGNAAKVNMDGVLVQPQVSGGVELLIGTVRDPMWGPVLAVGLGGVWVEVLRDTSLIRLPATPDQVGDALRSLRGFRLLEGLRGTTKADLDTLARVIADIASVAYRLGDRLESLEINPLVVNGSEVLALDALIQWRSDN
ncbi:CoA-binding protein [Gordonia sp. SID5947]|uniref:acetate--CoA ligase family protein n=1 Tax=Gordonia sp. SID5947 TaxID=2690315 RepID=UPI00136E95E9|nr:acetate--CoA ligase family protein [Gordonia sp. SID5947]MYR08004.1 CoA-binding protein [Gordonia sp. SID5947]